MNDIISKVPRRHFIAGEWVGEPTVDVTNPATGEALAQVADADEATARAALDAACDAAEEWAATDPRERAEILRRAFELINERADEFATVMTLEMGKPIAEAHGEVSQGADFLRWFSEEAVRVHGRFGRAPFGPMRIITDRKPVGPVLAITPWNFPLAMATRKLGPAIAAGCTTVLKPSVQTPFTALLLARALTDAGLPKGVLNVFTTSKSKETTTALLQDPRLRKVTFTGSTSVGQTLLRQSADNVLRTSMELGGNAPLIVLEGADLDTAVEGALQGKMRNNGEACTAANRFYIHESLADEFVRRIEAELRDYKVGPGIEEDTKLSALINDQAVDDIVELIDDAVSSGAKLRLGGKKLDRPGSFLPPTLLTDIAPGSRIEQEEIFGPVVAIQTFSDVDDAVRRANSSNFGLMSYVFGDQFDGLRVAERLEYGLVAVNAGMITNPAAPFGGMKHSGLGKEGSFEGIDEYLETKYYGMPL